MAHGYYVHEKPDFEFLDPRKCETVYLAPYFSSPDCRLASDTWMDMWQRQDCHGLDAEVEECCKQRSEQNHLLISRISIGRWKNTFTFFRLHFSFTTLGWEKKVPALFFSAVESVWNDPLRRLVKCEDFGLNDWYLRHVLMGFKDTQRVVERCWKIFKMCFKILKDVFLKDL